LEIDIVLGDQQKGGKTMVGEDANAAPELPNLPLLYTTQT
jgi:hypothetical protein